MATVCCITVSLVFALSVLLLSMDMSLAITSHLLHTSVGPPPALTVVPQIPSLPKSTFPPLSVIPGLPTALLPTQLSISNSAIAAVSAHNPNGGAFVATHLISQHNSFTDAWLLLASHACMTPKIKVNAKKDLDTQFSCGYHINSHENMDWYLSWVQTPSLKPV